MPDKELVQNQFLLYKNEQGDVKVEVLLQDETIWLTQKKMGDLFSVETNTINYHLKEIFKSSELDENSVIRKIRITASDGKNYDTTFYNLDAIISVGYRVNSKQAVHFRIWATSVLKEYIIKGFALDDERLKNGKHFGKDYFRELLERIREIRTSERRLYQQLKDIYSLSVDYDKKNISSILFFAEVQNKVHYAITGKTAAEIIDSRADHAKENMGLTSWDNERIYKKDVIIAKNYLEENELQELRLIVNMFLDTAELKTRRQEYIKIADWIDELDRFISYQNLKVLNGLGTVSRLQAEKKALKEYKEFRKQEQLKEKKESIKEVEADIKELERVLKKGDK
jgi:hypothetical protein